MVSALKQLSSPGPAAGRLFARGRPHRTLDPSWQRGHCSDQSTAQERQVFKACFTKYFPRLPMVSTPRPSPPSPALQLWKETRRAGRGVVSGLSSRKKWGAEVFLPSCGAPVPGKVPTRVSRPTLPRLGQGLWTRGAADWSQTRGCFEGPP